MNSTDQRIDQLLHALATTAAPIGLEQRISARMAQHAAEDAEHDASLFPRILSAKLANTSVSTQRRYAIAAALLLVAAGYLAISRHRSQQEIVAVPPARTTTPSLSGSAPMPVVLTSSTTTKASRLHQPLAPAPQPSPATQNDPDAIALAETLAPSHPAPPLPLTTQEALLARSTRLGQPIEVAELETRRETALTAIASARERSSLRQYIRGLLGPLATAQALTPSSPPSDPQPPTQPADAEPPSSK
ncbi:hypothetical protein GOB94_01985 [Granulicella sp. 5B5]|uniref:hypothetical protein n=1 Tax=Granulicella sp. 5B5 TaxID=1617967 RepID=UPI0015F727D1|nr:hypothetical protein [Granulicella sp. 5B5]QMV17608.1 hypothetical protein GOB94_01985 [Granulicella sp. 5B5]